jgi:hypothetical protein
MYLTGEFPDRESAVAALHSLKARGVEQEDLEVFATEPPDLPPGVLDRPSRMSFYAVCGAAATGSLATLFVYFTQHHYPLVTGGMPVFSFWATGVITYEMTMLGAIASTFVLLLWESGLLRWRDRSPVPAVEPGSTYVRVRCQDREVAETGECLYRAGAVRVEKLK